MSDVVGVPELIITNFTRLAMELKGYSPRTSFKFLSLSMKYALSLLEMTCNILPHLATCRSILVNLVVRYRISFKRFVLLVELRFILSSISV